MFATTARSMAGAYVAYARDATRSETERMQNGRKAKVIIAVCRETREWLKWSSIACRNFPSTLRT